MKTMKRIQNTMGLSATKETRFQAAPWDFLTYWTNKTKNLSEFLLVLTKEEKTLKIGNKYVWSSFNWPSIVYIPGIFLCLPVIMQISWTHALNLLGRFCCIAQCLKCFSLSRACLCLTHLNLKSLWFEGVALSSSNLLLLKKKNWQTIFTWNGMLL